MAPLKKCVCESTYSQINYIKHAVQLTAAVTTVDLLTAP